MTKTRSGPDIAGILTGTVLAGGSTIWMLNEHQVIQTADLGLSVALLLVVSGAIGLLASRGT